MYQIVQAEEEWTGCLTLEQEIQGSVDPQPAHCRSIRVPRPRPIEMNDISCILEVHPIVPGENVAPRTVTSGKSLEATHLLHTIHLTITEMKI